MSRLTGSTFLSAVLVCMALTVSSSLGSESIDGLARIIGGSPTRIELHPYQVAVRVHTGGGIEQCGGALITRKWILTAAHCVRGNPSTAIQARAGITFLTINVLSSPGWTAIDRVIPYSSQAGASDPKGMTSDDIALLEVSDGINDENSSPVAVAGPQAIVSAELMVTGWGYSEGGIRLDQLQSLTLPYVTNDTCNEAASYNGAIQPAMLCAGSGDGKGDACQGDSGGPLVMPGANGAVLVGVVSMGFGCARRLKYGVYARVSCFSDWIWDTVRIEASSSKQQSCRA